MTTRRANRTTAERQVCLALLSAIVLSRCDQVEQVQRRRFLRDRQFAKGSHGVEQSGLIGLSKQVSKPAFTASSRTLARTSALMAQAGPGESPCACLSPRRGASRRVSPTCRNLFNEQHRGLTRPIAVELHSAGACRWQGRPSNRHQKARSTASAPGMSNPVPDLHSVPRWCRLAAR